MEIAVKELEKLSLAHLPTPIQYLDKLSNDLGKKIYVKRDDYTGMEVSGNKIRKLEYSLAEALEKGCDTVITLGAIQSNHCRATAFAANKLGLDCHLILTGEKADHYEGNTFLNLLAGAKIHFVSSEADRYAVADEFSEQLITQGHRPYYIPIGASNAIGSHGYMDCMKEIVCQECEQGLCFDTICLAVGSGGTYAGLWFENEKEKYGKDILGISVADDTATFTKSINEIIKDLNKEYGEPLEDKLYNFHLVDDYIGEGYAKTTEKEIQFLTQIAQRTGIVFDPCYTGKGFRGLVEEIIKGKLPESQSVLFIHTGGLFGWTESSRDLALNTLKDNVE